MSELDEQRFGVRTAKAVKVTPDNLTSVLGFCRENQVELLIARCSAVHIGTVHSMEKEEFLLMDTLVYFSARLDDNSILDDDGSVSIRPIRPGEEQEVREVAEKAFKGYYGHYHADERLDRTKCDEVYVDWAYRSCLSKELADEVLVAEIGGIEGFATLRINTPEEGEGVLFAVSPSVQGRGVYRKFMINGMKWCFSKGCSSMVVSTQITNLAVQRSWARLGFVPTGYVYTFHKWFD